MLCGLDHNICTSIEALKAMNCELKVVEIDCAFDHILQKQSNYQSCRNKMKLLKVAAIS